MKRKVTAGLVCAGLLVLAGCTNGQSAPKVTRPVIHVTASETTACHAFSEAFYKNAASLSIQQIRSVAGVLRNSSSADLQSEGIAFNNDILSGNDSAIRANVRKVAATCYNLGLIDKNGNPT